MYGQLPSYVLANGTIFDLIVTEALAEYESKLMDPLAKKQKEMSQEEMMAMIKAVRSDK